MRDLRMLLWAALSAIQLTSAGCKSDCERAFDHLIELMKDDPNGEDVFGVKARLADAFETEAKGAFIRRCKQRATREGLRCVLDAKDIKVLYACQLTHPDAAPKTDEEQYASPEHLPSGTDVPGKSGRAPTSDSVREMLSEAASQNTAGMRLYKRGQYSKARARFRAAIALDTSHPTPHYNAACQSAQLKDIPATIQHLRDWYRVRGESVSARAIVAKDPDFDSVRTNPTFMNLLAEWR